MKIVTRENLTVDDIEEAASILVSQFHGNSPTRNSLQWASEVELLVEDYWFESGFQLPDGLYTVTDAVEDKLSGE